MPPIPRNLRRHCRPVEFFVRRLEGSPVPQDPGYYGTGGGAFDFSRQASLLAVTLQAAVPLWFHEIDGWRRNHSPDGFRTMVQNRATVCGQYVAEHGDALMFRVGGKSAEAFNRLAEGIALMALCPGGVTVFGTHWQHTVARRSKQT